MSTAGIKTAVETASTNDTTFMALITGGVHADVREISRQSAPTAYDANGELLPCVLLKIESQTPHPGPIRTASRLFFTLIAYQRGGYDAITPALDRAFALFHDKKLTAVANWNVTNTDESQELEDQALQCSMRFSRFLVIASRA